MIIMDTSKWTAKAKKQFLAEANATVEEAKLTCSSWDKYMRINAPSADILQAVWYNPDVPGGLEYGTLKGEGKLMLIAQSKKSVPVTMMRFRLLNRDVAFVTWAIYGDGRQQYAGYRSA